jgi:hypothetical protein
MVPVIGLRFKNTNTKVGNPRPAQPPDEFFSFSGEHRTADNFNPSAPIKLNSRLYKHGPAEFG